jgi:hypothetical protein
VSIRTIEPSARTPERFRADAVFDARRTEQFQRAHMEKRRARQLGALLQTLDGQGRDAVLCEEHGGRQSDQPAAGKKYGNFPVVVQVHPPTIPARRSAG